MEKYIINSPDDFNDYDWEYEAKGCLEVEVTILKDSYTFNFYDIRRIYSIQRALLHKDLKGKAPLIEPNLRRNLGKWST